MEHIYGTKRALVFGKPVPFFAKSGVKDGKSLDFFYYEFLIVFLSDSYRILKGFFGFTVDNYNLGFRKWGRGRVPSVTWKLKQLSGVMLMF